LQRWPASSTATPSLSLANQIDIQPLIQPRPLMHCGASDSLLTLMTDLQSSALPSRAPISLWAIAAALAAMGIFLDAETMVALGPMRRSLTADNAMTRETAEKTLMMARVASLILAAATLTLIKCWRPWTGSRFATYICNIRLPERQKRAPLLENRSLIIFAGVFLLAVVYAALAQSLVPRDIRAFIRQEDGAIEQATAILFLLASIVSIGAAVASLRTAPPTHQYAQRRMLWHVLMAAFFFLCFGEELSWGQRILGFETPDSIKELNVQSEVNLHNMLGYLADQVFIVGMFVYGAAIPFLVARSEFWRRAIYWTGLPVASLGLAIGFGLASATHDWSLYAVLPGSKSVRGAELREALTALCCLLAMLEFRSRYKRERQEHLATTAPA